MMFPDKRVRQAAARWAASLPGGGLGPRRGGSQTPICLEYELTRALAAHWRHPADEFPDGEVHSAAATGRPLQGGEAGAAPGGAAPADAGAGRLAAQGPAGRSLHRLFPARIADRSMKRIWTSAKASSAAGSRPATNAWTPRRPASWRWWNTTASTLPPQFAGDVDSEEFRDLRHALSDRLLAAPGTGEAEYEQQKVADALLGLDRKLEGQAQRNKQNWNARLVEVAHGTAQEGPRAAGSRCWIIRISSARPTSRLTACFDEKHRKVAAHLFLAAVKKDDDFAWSGPLIELLSLLPAEEVRPVFRGQWDNYGLRDALLLQLDEQTGGSGPRKVPDGAGVRPAAGGAGLSERAGGIAARRGAAPARPAGAAAAAADAGAEGEGERGRRSAPCWPGRPDSRSSSRRTAATRPRSSAFTIRCSRGSRRSIRSWPRRRRATATKTRPSWTKLLQTVPWEKGDAGRGEAVFRARGCVDLPHRHDAAWPRPDRRDEPLLACRPVRRDHLPQPRRGAAVPRHAHRDARRPDGISASSPSSRPTASSCKPAPRPRCASPRRTSPRAAPARAR